MKTFNDLKFVPRAHVTQARMNFPNGYGVSVVIGEFTYGGPDGLYELGVLWKGHLCYKTFITNDVCGYLTEDEVTALMKQVQELPNRPPLGEEEDSESE